jgi:hypothetical protein
MKIRKLWRNKNQAVYDLSIAPRFPHVHWMGPVKG